MRKVNEEGNTENDKEFHRTDVAEKEVLDQAQAGVLDSYTKSRLKYFSTFTTRETQR